MKGSGSRRTDEKQGTKQHVLYKDSKGVGVGQFGGECIKSNVIIPLMHNYLEVG